MTSLYLIYTDEQLSAADQLLEDFTDKANKKGVALKIAEFKV